MLTAVNFGVNLAKLYFALFYSKTDIYLFLPGNLGCWIIAKMFVYAAKHSNLVANNNYLLTVTLWSSGHDHIMVLCCGFEPLSDKKLNNINEPLGVNFINVFTRSFYARRSQKWKKLLDLTVFLRFLGSAFVKAACIMMLKFTLGLRKRNKN